MTDSSLAWEVLERETAYSCPGFDIVHEEVRLPTGTETDFDYLTEPPSVVILPFTSDDELVLVHEWRQAVDRVNRGLPAGSADPDDDTLEKTAARELEEETGYVAGDLEKLIAVEPANGLAAIEHHYFLATDCTPTGTQSLDFDETNHVETARYETLLSEVLAGEIRDGRTVLGVLFYHATGSDTLTNDPRKADS